jgi:aldehyde:ferredoxin oxidoreductase
MDGWVGKILRVDLSAEDYMEEDLDPGFAERYIGSQGFGTKILMDEVDPTVDALSPENKLVFATGPCTGTGAVCGARAAWIAKSPLTGGIAFSNTGAYFPAELKFAGYDMIIFEGQADEPVYLWIEDDAIEIRDASDLWGKTVEETEDLIRSEIDNKWVAMDTRIACIGPSGENQALMAAIMNDKHRAAARGGIGAVMGSKNLKAIAVRGTGGITIARPQAFHEAVMNALEQVKASPVASQAFPAFGSGSLLNLYNSAGVLPHRNFQDMGVEETTNISGETIAEKYLIRNRGCFGCPLACGGSAEVAEGRFKGRGERPEYETHWIAASCGVYNPEALLRFNALCNELGLDTIDAGSTIACAMELGERGYLPADDVGFALKFGDADALVTLTEQMAYREGFGDTMADGGYAMAEKYGHSELFMHVKKMAFTAYDVRTVKGMALNMATSVRGACHNRGYTPAQEILGMPQKIDPLEIEGKAALVKELQDETAAVMDAGGICLFSITGQAPPTMWEQVTTASGLEYTFEEAMKAGERIWNLQRLFNLQAGLTKEHDTIPRRFLEEPAKGGPNQGNVYAAEELQKLLDEYYDLRGWDKETGYPTKEKLAALGLEEYNDLLPD